MVPVTSTSPAAWTFRAATWVTLGWFVGWQGVALLGASAIVVHGAALAAHRSARGSVRATAALAAGLSAILIPVAGVQTFQFGWWTAGVVACVMVYGCHAVAYLMDVRRGTADPADHFASMLYLLQLPVIVAGPLSRFNEFHHQLSRTDVTMASFSYGVRRLVTGVVKVWLIAGPLWATADTVFGLRVTRLSTGTAWLGAVCAALAGYFVISGLADVGIGAGRIAGLRYQENFRRPYAADSLHDFWRRWNITLMAWLRDYAAFPLAGYGRPTLVQFLATCVGFVVIGAWHEWTGRMLIWAVYSASWLALEAVWLGAVMERLPRPVRHVYVLAVVTFGWMLLWAAGPGPLLGYVEAMIGLSIPTAPGAGALTTPGVWAALVAALVFAGPPIGALSRWRVSVDAATASLLMMLAATGMFLWHLIQLLRRFIVPAPRRSR